MDTEKNLRILLIEDNPGDARLISEMLAEEVLLIFEIVHADHLGGGLGLLAEERFDLVLLDLSLPDSHGLETFRRLYAYIDSLPVIVLTGNTAADDAIAALRAGAQDYLSKEELDANLLIRSVRYGIERFRLTAALTVKNRKTREDAESNFLRLFSTRPTPGVTSKLFGMGPIREMLPERFDHLVVCYDDLMDKYLDQMTYKVEYAISDAIREMADELGFLKARARDVIDIHTTVLERKKERVNLKKYRAYADEGRLLLIELMGFMAEYYRRYSL